VTCNNIYNKIPYKNSNKNPDKTMLVFRVKIDFENDVIAWGKRGR